MVINSVFMCDNVQEVVSLVKMQPDVLLFQKSYMELDQSNMI